MQINHFAKRLLNRSQWVFNNLFLFLQQAAIGGTHSGYWRKLTACVITSVALHLIIIQYIFIDHFASAAKNSVLRSNNASANNAADRITFRFQTIDSVSTVRSTLHIQNNNGISVDRPSRGPRRVILSTQKQTKEPELLSEAFAFVETDFGIRAVGRVVIKVFIDAAGLVDEVEIVESTTNRVIEEQITSQIRRSQWAPAEINGQKVRSSIVLEIDIS